MRLLFAPSNISAFLASLPILQCRFFWVGIVPLPKFFLVFRSHVIGMARKQGEVFVAIISTITIQMMHAFSRIKDAADAFLHHQAVFVDVTLRVLVRMIWRVDPHVTGGMHPSSTFPQVMGLTLLYLMTANESLVLAFVVATLGAIVCRDGRGQSAPAFAESGLIHRFLQLSSRGVLRSGFEGAAPVTAHEATTSTHCDSAPALAGGWCMSFSHGCEHIIEKDV